MNFRLRTAAVAALTAVTALALSPAAAFASDTSTPLTTAELTAKVTAIRTAFNAAGKVGYHEAGTLRNGQGVVQSTYAVTADNVHGRLRLRYHGEGQPGLDLTQVAGRGFYLRLRPADRAAVKSFTGRAVTHSFYADKTMTAGEVEALLPTTDDLAGATGALVTHDDGRSDVTMNLGDETKVLHLDAAGVLTGTDDMMPKAGTAHSTVTYGPEKIDLPAAALVVPGATVEQAVFYVDPRPQLAVVARNTVALSAMDKKTVANLRSNTQLALMPVSVHLGKAITVVDIADGVELKTYNKPTGRWVTVRITLINGKYVIK